MNSKRHSGSGSRIEDILLRAEVVDEMQLRAAKAKMANWGGRLPKVLADMGFASEEAITETIGQALQLEVVHLGTALRDATALSKLDAKYCQQHGIFPMYLRDRTLHVAMSDPTDLKLVDEVKSKVGARVQPMLASESEILSAISRHYLNQEYKPIEKERGVRRFTGEGLPAVGAHPSPPPLELDLHAGPRPPGPDGALGGLSDDFLARPPSANTLLDEIMDRRRDDLDFTKEELSRLEAARKNQEKTTTILRALQSLLAEKGY